MRHATPARSAEQLRLLEGWLPLAQDANQRYGWSLDPEALEALILQAAPALQQARTSLEAQIALWSMRARQATRASVE